jgi:hypothetical protein
MAISDRDQAQYSHWRPQHTLVVDGQAVRFRDVCVYEFSIGDVEDPDIMAGEPLWKWQNSEAGSWVMEHAVEQPYWMRQLDHTSYSHRYCVMARLSEQNEMFWQLKWGNIK